MLSHTIRAWRETTYDTKTAVRHVTRGRGGGKRWAGSGPLCSYLNYVVLYTDTHFGTTEPPPSSLETTKGSLFAQHHTVVRNENQGHGKCFAPTTTRPRPSLVSNNGGILRPTAVDRNDNGGVVLDFPEFVSLDHHCTDTTGLQLSWCYVHCPSIYCSYQVLPIFLS